MKKEKKKSKVFLKHQKDSILICVPFSDILFSGVTESLFWGAKGGPYLHLGGGGGVTRGPHHNDFFPITFIVHNQKSNGGSML